MVRESICGNSSQASTCFELINRGFFVEFEIWQKDLPATIVVSNLGHVGPDGRGKSIKRWMSQGGVLLISDRMFGGIKHVLQPDVLVLDEAHTMVRNTKTNIYKALSSILTPRRIGK